MGLEVGRDEGGESDAAHGDALLGRGPLLGPCGEVRGFYSPAGPLSSSLQSTSLKAQHQDAVGLAEFLWGSAPPKTPGRDRRKLGRMTQRSLSDDECRILNALLDPSLKRADRTVEALADRLSFPKEHVLRRKLEDLAKRDPPLAYVETEGDQPFAFWGTTPWTGDAVDDNCPETD